MVVGNIVMIVNTMSVSQSIKIKLATYLHIVKKFKKKVKCYVNIVKIGYNIHSLSGILRLVVKTE